MLGRTKDKAPPISWDADELILTGDEGIRIEWEQIGEGISGDYDPQDPNDVELLRLTVLLHDEPLEGCSYCTDVQVGCPPQTLERLSRSLLDQIHAERAGGGRGNRTCEQASWASWRAGGDRS